MQPLVFAALYANGAFEIAWYPYAEMGVRGRDSQLLSGTLEKRHQNQRFPDNLGRLCVPALCTGTVVSAQADSSGW